MAALKTRDFAYGFSTSGGARWAFFAIFIVLIILVIFGTLRVNKRRLRLGAQPIYGTSWMTPPSYVQSQNQQDRGNSGPEGVYVPTYTAEANDTDLGYYDAQGVFHSTAKPPVGPNFTGLGNEHGEGIPAPDQAHRRNTSTTDGIPLSEVPPIQSPYVFSDEVAPPPGPPPGVSSSEHSEPLFNDEDFIRPLGPPPSTAPRKN